MRYCAYKDGLCRACYKQFSTRIRLLDHLADRRRTVCRESLASDGHLRLTYAEVHRLDEKDRQERNAAHRQGRTQVRSLANQSVGSEIEFVFISFSILDLRQQLLSSEQKYMFLFWVFCISIFNSLMK